MNSQPVGEDEVELHSRQTAWVRGATNTKMGHATLTSQRLLFFDTKFMGGAAGGALGAAIADRLQKRHEDGGPLLALSLASITKITRVKKMLSKDRIELTTPDEVYLFSDGWKDWSPLLHEVLTTTHGRQLVESGADSWSVQPG